MAESEEYIVVKKGKYVHISTFNSLLNRVIKLENTIFGLQKAEKGTLQFLSSEQGIEIIINTTCEYFSLNRLEVTLSEKQKLNKSDKIRSKELVLCRKICYYFIDLYYPLIPHTKIANKFGDRERTTIIHALGSIKDLMETDNKLENNINELNRIIKNKLIV